MLIDSFRVLNEKVFQPPELTIILLEELRHAPARLNRQVAAKQHAIETA
jgi:hypothetical protein